MPIQKVGFEESLGRMVVERGLCVGCASCVISCPFNCLEYADSLPKIIGDCKTCGICAQVCPRFSLSIPSLEEFIFGRRRSVEEEFGIYKRVVVAQATNNEILSVCQDGGVVTSLLIFALEEGLINGAALSSESPEEPLKAVPKLALSKSDIMRSAGTRYTYSPNMLALREGVQKKIGKMAFVGTPCQIHAFRRMEMLPLKKYADAVKFTAGLFCSESFTYEGLVKDFLQGKMGIELSEVVKVNIKGKMILKMRSNEVKALSLKEVKDYACKFCRVCPDFSAELADISVGGLGLEGWSLTIVRTEIGEEIFKGAELKGIIKARPVENSKIIDLLIKMSKRKRETSTKTV
ncbi:MAG: Coenzyme F420 hydrogenase/dehydrogenase, beta subunit C-terminal domain [Candidatus Bathyarchaeia archaeon]